MLMGVLGMVSEKGVDVDVDDVNVGLSCRCECLTGVIPD